MLTAAIIAGTIALQRVETCAVFTDSVKVTEKSAAGKRYSKTIRVTYVDANCDGKATAIDLRNADLKDLMSFLAWEFPAEFERLATECVGLELGVSLGRHGGLPAGGEAVGGDLRRQVSVREYDNREAYLSVWKQFGSPVVSRAEAAIRVANRELERDKRSQGRSR